jgi:hypothetical protein
VGQMYKAVCSWENLRLAYRKASRGKRGKDAAASFGYKLADNMAGLPASGSYCLRVWCSDQRHCHHRDGAVPTRYLVSVWALQGRTTNIVHEPSAYNRRFQDG